MNVLKSILVCCMLPATFEARAQVPAVLPQVRVKDAMDSKVTVVEVAAHFVTAIRLPEPVNSVAVGDPALFLVEHSEREPQLVLVKALTERTAETNLLISSIHGRQFSLLLVSRVATGRRKDRFSAPVQTRHEFSDRAWDCAFSIGRSDEGDQCSTFTRRYEN